ncbi:hypothetical protein M8J76_006598 [Diaphorina citri]|nr:hypothetical protein M8J76_006598 [Diaphorina citri]
MLNRHYRRDLIQVFILLINFHVLLCHKVKEVSSKVKEGSVRLTGGKSHFEGNVQVYHLGKWGYICDDEWGSEDGAVICRQLGKWKLHAVTTRSYFGHSKSKSNQ